MSRTESAAERPHCCTKTILVTAFEAFGGDEMNPTEMVLGRLPGTVGGYGIEKLLLPVEFVRCRELAFAKHDELRPAAVVMLGQAGGRGAVTPETRGRNVMDARMPDNAGYMPENVPVVEGGPEILYSTLPVGRICESVRALGIPCEPSGDAGGYVCNALLYGMLQHNGGEVPTGFIHVPFVPEQGHRDRPALPLADIEKAVEAAIEAVVRELERSGLTEILLEGPYSIMDILPEQVSAERGSRYFAVERYYLQPERLRALRRRYAEILLRLNCYFDMEASFDGGESWETAPDPEAFAGRLAGLAGNEYLRAMFEAQRAMIDITPDTTHMTVYDPEENLQEKLRALAAAEGLFVWSPPEGVV